MYTPGIVEQTKTAVSHWMGHTFSDLPVQLHHTVLLGVVTVWENPFLRPNTPHTTPHSAPGRSTTTYPINKEDL